MDDHIYYSSLLNVEDFERLVECMTLGAKIDVITSKLANSIFCHDGYVYNFDTTYMTYKKVSNLIILMTYITNTIRYLAMILRQC